MAVILSKKNVIPERIYRWKKYSTTTKTAYDYDINLTAYTDKAEDGETSTGYIDGESTTLSVECWYANNFTFDSDNGYFKLTNPTHLIDSCVISYPDNPSGKVSIKIPANVYYAYKENYIYNMYYIDHSDTMSHTLQVDSDGTIYRYSIFDYTKAYEVLSEKTTVTVKDTYMDLVESSNPSEYPVNGVSGNYWYERM